MQNMTEKFVCSMKSIQLIIKHTIMYSLITCLQHFSFLAISLNTSIMYDSQYCITYLMVYSTNPLVRTSVVT